MSDRKTVAEHAGLVVEARAWADELEGLLFDGAPIAEVGLIRRLADALEDAEKVRRLHEVATQRMADVRAARDRAEARFAARGNGLSILADFYAAVGDVLTVEEGD